MRTVQVPVPMRCELTFTKVDAPFLGDFLSCCSGCGAPTCFPTTINLDCLRLLGCAFLPGCQASCALCATQPFDLPQVPECSYEERAMRTAQAFQRRHGIHPYALSPAAFLAYTGVAKADAEQIGLFPEETLACAPQASTQVGLPPGSEEREVRHFCTGQYRVDTLCLPDASPQGSLEMEVEAALDKGFVTWSQLQKWFAELPEHNLDRGGATTGTNAELQTPKTFVTDAYARASFHGLRRGTKDFPWLTCLLCSIIRHVAPGHRFTSITLARNVMTAAHKDSHNDDCSWNLLLPCSMFLHGELWLESASGTVPLFKDGKCGELRSTQKPCFFRPRTLHATMPWHGQRLVMVAFHTRNADRLQRCDMSTMLSMGFYPMDYAYAEYSRLQASADDDGS